MKSKKLKIFLGIIGSIFFLSFFFGGGLEKQAAQEMNKIENQVAQDAITQYEIAVREGDKMQIYIQAGMVSAAFLQAKDEENYKKWKSVEKRAGRAVGLR